jgi:hypothetical protein
MDHGILTEKVNLRHLFDLRHPFPDIFIPLPCRHSPRPEAILRVHAQKAVAVLPQHGHVPRRLRCHHLRVETPPPNVSPSSAPEYFFTAQVSCCSPWPTARGLRLQVPLSPSIRNPFHVKNITLRNSFFSVQHCNVALCHRRGCGCRELRCRRRAPLHPPKEIEPTSGSPRPFFRAVMRPPATAVNAAADASQAPRSTAKALGAGSCCAAAAGGSGSDFVKVGLHGQRVIQ